MKIIEHSYGADLDWVVPLANKLDGKVDGNFIITPNDIFTGTRYVLDCGDDIVAYYVDVTNKKEVTLIQKNMKNDFIGIYYNLTEGDVKYSSTSFYQRNIGRWQYNLLVIDSSLETNYHIKAKTRSLALCIFIKKSRMASFCEQNNIVLESIDKITNPAKNTLIRFDRMSDESFHLIKDLQKVKVGGPIFDLNLIGTVHMVLSNFFRKMSTTRIIVQTVNESDLSRIIKAQMYLINHIQDQFPSIEIMAQQASMSQSKFKNLFRKITGKTPNKFFMDNKLIKSKELLEEKKMSILQISEYLNFTNNSYFSSKFKDHFGLSPKAFVSQL